MQPTTQLIELAINKDCDLNKLEKLLDLQERWQAEQAKQAFYSAMAKFQSDLPTIKKQKQAAFLSNNGQPIAYNYASLDDIAEQIKPLLSRHGFSYRFENQFETVDNRPRCRVICYVTHKDGHTIACEMIGPPDNSGVKNVMQQLASTITYLRRYALTGALGITASDDVDGHQPQQDQAKPQKSPTPTTQNKPSGLPRYSDVHFQKKLPEFTKAIQSGQRTPQEIIRMIGSQFQISPEQQSQLHTLTNAQQGAK